MKDLVELLFRISTVNLRVCGNDVFLLQGTQFALLLSKLNQNNDSSQTIISIVTNFDVILFTDCFQLWMNTSGRMKVRLFILKQNSFNFGLS